MVDLKQCRIPGWQKEITTLINDMLEAGGLVPVNALHSSPVRHGEKVDGA